MARQKGSTNKGKQGSLEKKVDPVVKVDLEDVVVKVDGEVVSFQEQLGDVIDVVQSAKAELTQIAEDLGVDLNQESTIDSDKPTEALQEESAESNTDVAPEEENASESNTKPSEAIHTIVLSHGDINKLVPELLYVAYLGGTLTKGFLPRLSSPPYIVKVDLDNDGYNSYLNGFERKEHDATKEYDTIVISNPDPLKFIEKLLEVGKNEVYMIPHKAVRLGMPFKVALHTRKPFSADANTALLLNNIKYSRDELHKLSFADLKLLASRHGVKASSTPRLVELILQSQNQ